ncbi:hypothetical protein J6590_086539 [Homalodisca vitripennis]|nr:hypothetical protein J6590_086539 [Homalodisca vitripennis]
MRTELCVDIARLGEEVRNPLEHCQGVDRVEYMIVARLGEEVRNPLEHCQGVDRIASMIVARVGEEVRNPLEHCQSVDRIAYMIVARVGEEDCVHDCSERKRGISIGANTKKKCRRDSAWISLVLSSLEGNASRRNKSQATDADAFRKETTTSVSERCGSS